MTDPIPARTGPAPGARHHARHRAAALAALVALAGLGVMVLLWRSAAADLRGDVEAEFDFRVRDAEARLADRMAAYQQVLRGAAGRFAGSPHVSREAFRDYVTALDLAEHFPGIQGVGWAALVPWAERERHVAAVRAEGFPDYDLRPPGRREPLTAIVYLEPFSGRNLRAFGYDMRSEPVRRAAMEAACDEGRTALSGRVRLVQETGQDEQAGFLMYLPVYRGGQVPATVEARRAALAGWVYAPFRADDLMRGVLGERGNELGLSLYDGEVADPAALLHDSGAAAGAGPGGPGPEATRRLVVAGRPWTLVARALPGLASRYPSREPALAALVGGAVSLLLALLVWLLASGRERAERLAQAMTGDLLEARRARQDTEVLLQEIVETTPDLVFVKDDAGRLLLANPAYEKAMGRPLAELLGRTPEQIHGAEGGVAVAGNDLLVQRTGAPHAFEEHLVTPAGPRVFLATKAPRRDASGAIVGVIGIARDITERKRAEEALRDREARFGSVIEAIEDGVIHLRADGSISGCNSAAERMLGLSQEEMAAASAHRERWRVLDADGEPLSPEALPDVVTRRTGVPQSDVVIGVPRPDGSTTWLSMNVRPLQPGPGPLPTPVVATFRDVTEARLREAEAWERQQRLALMMERSNDGFWDRHIPSGRVHINPRCATMLGYEPGELPMHAQTWEDGLHPDDRARTFAALEAHLRGETPLYEAEFRQRCKDGSWLWVQSIGKVVERAADGTPVRLIGTQTDITARRTAEDALRASEERYRLLFEASPFAVFVTREGGGILDANPAACRMVGRTLEEIRRLGRAGLVVEDERLRAAVATRLAAGHARAEITMRRADGQTFPAEVDTVTVDVHRPDSASFVLARDITGRVQAEAERRLADDRLRESSDQLRALAARLQEAREQETARISRDLHDELGQLLTGLQLDLSGLEEEVDALPAAPAREPLLDKVVAASELTGTIIATVQRIALELRPAALDRVGLPAALRQDARRFERRSGVEVRVETAAGFPDLAPAAATALYRIGQESLTNVARHAGARLVEVRLEARGGEVVLEVEDDGRGLAAGSEERAASLGLLGMKERARALGGDVAFAPGARGGTLVRARLPAAAATRKGDGA